jgi:hypothetical protein
VYKDKEDEGDVREHVLHQQSQERLQQSIPTEESQCQYRSEVVRVRGFKKGFPSPPPAGSSE